MKTLTVFTPTYNRLHTITRTYESLCRQTCRDFDWLIIDDGSCDGTRIWVESLGPKVISMGQKFDWMGRVKHINDNDDDNDDDNVNNCITSDHFFIQTPKLRIEYIYKPNGGLYTGYNVAYQTIETELCVCIDSDDFMPDNAVEKIVGTWGKLSEVEKKKYCGIIGLDFNVKTGKPIGGYFINTSNVINYYEIKHKGDTKEVLRTELLKAVAPQIGFYGEKDFNPFYMLSQIVDKYPILIENSNLCWVEYQTGTDSMSQAIFKQFKRSPNSYAKYRINQMKLKHNKSIGLKYKLAVHYISSCIFAKDKFWLANTPYKLLTICAIPLGIALNIYIRYKAR